MAAPLEPLETRPFEEHPGQGRVFDSVHADVHHHGARLHVVGPDDARPPNRRHQDVGLSGHRGEVRRAGVSHGDGGIGVQQEEGHRLADDVAASDDHRPATRDLDAAAVEELHDARRRARHEPRALLHQEADVDRAEAVHVLGGIHEPEDARCVDLLRQRRLHEDAVDVAAAAQGIDRGRHLLGGGRGGQARGFVVNPEVVAGLGLAPHVDGRGGVVPDEDDAEPRTRTSRRQGRDPVAELLADRLRHGRAVEQGRSHRSETENTRRSPNAASAAAT